MRIEVWIFLGATMKESLNEVSRAMPFSDDAEKGVLSCYLQDPVGLLGAAYGVVLPGWFYHPCNRMLYELLVRFRQEGRPVDLVTLSSHLIDAGEMDKLGGPAVLPDLYSFVPTPAHYEYYVGILKGKWWERECLRVTGEIQKAVYELGNEGGVEKVVAGAIGDLLNLSQEGRKTKWVPVKEIVEECKDRMESAVKNRGHVTGGVATGFTDLDRRTMGLRPGELFIIGARPAMGKSSLAMNFAENIAMANGHYAEFNQAAMPVGVVSLEMSRVDLVDRVVVGRSGVNMAKMATGMFSRGEMKDYVKAANELGLAPMYFLDVAKLSIQELLASARRMVLETGLKVLVVDYLQRMCSDSKRAQQNRNIEVAEISSGLKSMAKELDLVVFALAQVGRGAEDRPGCKPSLADLRESGDIEADADFVGLIYRPGYYARKKAKKAEGSGKGQSRRVGTQAGGHSREEEEDEILDDQAELIIAKARRGSVEPVPLHWDGPRTRFASRTNKLYSNDDGQREGGGGSGAAAPMLPRAPRARAREDDVWEEINGQGEEPEER